MPKIMLAQYDLLVIMPSCNAARSFPTVKFGRCRRFVKGFGGKNTCTNASCPLTTTIYCLSSFFTPHFCEGLSDIFTIASTHSPKPQFSTSFCQGRGFMLRPPIGSELKIYIIPRYTLLVSLF